MRREHPCTHPASIGRGYRFPAPSASRISKTAPPLRKRDPHAGRTRNAAQEARISGAPRAFGLKAVNVLGAVAMIAVAVKSKARGAC